MINTTYWNSDGQQISVTEFIQNFYGTLPNFFKTEADLRTIWLKPDTRKVFLEELANVGYGIGELETLQSLIDAENSDLFDVLEYIAFKVEPLSRQERVKKEAKKRDKGVQHGK